MVRSSQRFIDLSSYRWVFLQLDCNLAQVESRDKTGDATYLQVFGDWVGRSMGYQENGIGFADQAMASFNEASVPVSHSRPHHGHPQLSIVGMVNFPGKTLGNFSSGEIWVPKSVTDMICLPKSRLLTQVKSLLQRMPLKCALLRKGKGHITQGQSCTGSWVMKDGMWTGKVQLLAWRKPSFVISCQEKTMLRQYFGTNRAQIWACSSEGSSLTWHT